MKHNVGPRERVARLLVGAASGVAALALPRLGWWRLPLGLVAVSGIVTGATGYCPANQALGIDRSGEHKEPSPPIPV